MNSRGFTLIELLVVLVIIGVIVGMATVAFRDTRGEELEREARRLITILQLASEEATLRSETLGLRVADDGYAFLRRPQLSAEWQVIEDDKALGPRQLPAPLRLQLTVEGLDASKGASAPRNGESKGIQPHVYLFSSGELTPGFEINVVHPDLQAFYRITGREDGKLEFHEEQ